MKRIIGSIDSKNLIIPFIAFLMYAHIALNSTRIPTGDEPHYLIACQSVLSDLDFNLYNQYNSQSYLDFWPSAKLTPHIRKYGEEIWFPVHSYWFSLLITPFYYLGKVKGVYFFLTFILALNIYYLNKILLKILERSKQYLAFISSTIFVLIVPFTSSSFLIYPSIIGAFLCTLSIKCYVDFLDSRDIKSLRKLIVYISLLPFMHHSYLLISIFIFSFICIEQWKHWKKFVFPTPIVLGLIWILTPYLIGADFFLGSQNGDYFDISLNHFVSKLFYFVFDKTTGIVSNSPVFIILFFLPFYYSIGSRQNKYFRLVDISVFIFTCYLTFHSFLTINPGESPIARYFVPILPVCYISIIFLVSQNSILEIVFFYLSCLSLVIGLSILRIGCNTASCHYSLERYISNTFGDPTEIIFLSVVVVNTIFFGILLIKGENNSNLYYRVNKRIEPITKFLILVLFFSGIIMLFYIPMIRFLGMGPKMSILKIEQRDFASKKSYPNDQPDDELDIVFNLKLKSKLSLSINKVDVIFIDGNGEHWTSPKSNPNLWGVALIGNQNNPIELNERILSNSFLNPWSERIISLAIPKPSELEGRFKVSLCTSLGHLEETIDL